MNSFDPWLGGTGLSRFLYHVVRVGLDLNLGTNLAFHPERLPDFRFNGEWCLQLILGDSHV